MAEFCLWEIADRGGILEDLWVGIMSFRNPVETKVLMA
ncbi:hypothetical protein CpecG_0870 [Chlamydia pecorum MC/MarsBar]|nr:hypothetical protein CpecG_0870 [Chlamydia pecorum MC/MarsBar]ETF37260.1 hypothetical protein CpecF_0868 [Chlamydia pecorum DBDeUG]ETF37667.1 hypothetical protein CpecS_0866 [Chlamydia pecorum VR629]ETF39481.1 hypothetical protein CpecA_0870 [Chlamydia pecorum IPTaLE]